MTGNWLTLALWGGPVFLGVSIFLWSECRERLRRGTVPLDQETDMATNPAPVTPKWSLDRWVAIVDIVTKFLGVLALLVGAGWTYWIFVSHREGEWNLQVLVDTEIVKSPGNEALLVVHVNAKNIGLVDIEPYERWGLELNVFEHTNIAQERQKGHDAIIPWMPDDNEHVKPIVTDFNLLSRYGTGYTLHPGVQYHETEAVKVKKARLYGVSVRFYVKSKPTRRHPKPYRKISDSRYVFIPAS